MNARPAPERSGIPLPILVPLLGMLVALWFLRTALAPFFLAILLAYLMQPLATRLARHMRRGWAALLAILVFAVGFGLFLWMVVPPFVSQVERLITALPGWQAKAVERWLPWSSAHPVIMARLRQAVEGLDPMTFLQGLRIAGIGLLGWFLELLTLILVPLIIYYLLVEGPGLARWTQELIPERFRDRTEQLLGEIHRRLGGYLRGQLAVALVMSLLQGLAFHILKVPYAWVLGLLAGTANVVPYSYYVTALPLALLFAALDGAGWGHILLILLVFEVVQKAEAFYLTPVWVGRATGLHPLEVLLAIFIFGFAFGLFGLIFAVPLMIIFQTLSRFCLTRYKAHPWFRG